MKDELSKEYLVEHKDYLEHIIGDITYHNNARHHAQQKLRLVYMIERRDKAINILQERLGFVREALALMAEGEGEDPLVYQDMSRHHMVGCDEAMRLSKKILSGGGA